MAVIHVYFKSIGPEFQAGLTSKVLLLQLTPSHAPARSPNGIISWAAGSEREPEMQCGLMRNGAKYPRLQMIIVQRLHACVSLCAFYTSRASASSAQHLA